MHVGAVEHQRERRRRKGAAQNEHDLAHGTSPSFPFEERAFARRGSGKISIG
jgi:hypothetical protein